MCESASGTDRACARVCDAVCAFFCTPDPRPRQQLLRQCSERLKVGAHFVVSLASEGAGVAPACTAHACLLRLSGRALHDVTTHKWRLLVCSFSSRAEASAKEALLLVQEAWGVKLAPGWSMDVPLSGWQGMDTFYGVSALELGGAALAGELVVGGLFVSATIS